MQATSNRTRSPSPVQRNTHSSESQLATTWSRHSHRLLAISIHKYHNGCLNRKDRRRVPQRPLFCPCFLFYYYCCSFFIWQATWREVCLSEKTEMIMDSGISLGSQVHPKKTRSEVWLKKEVCRVRTLWNDHCRAKRKMRMGTLPALKKHVSAEVAVTDVEHTLHQTRCH